MQRLLLSVLLLCLFGTTQGQTAYEYCYWLDACTDERYYGTSESERWSLQLDVADLSESLHQLHVQVKDTAGRWSAPHSRYFLKLPAVSNLRARYWFDDGEVTETEVINGLQSVDVSTLPQGLHFLHYQVKGNGGSYSSPRSALFIKMEAISNLRARYWFDDGEVTETEVVNGLQSIDISSLSQGVHFLHYQVVSVDGMHSPVRSAIFIKNQGEIVRYEYWLNNDVENTRIVAAQPMESFRLIEMLDVESYPIRPSAFQFEVEGSVPYIYGKNDFHARFYNSNGAHSEDSTTYVDEASKREVMDAILLRSGTRRTDVTPSIDSIRWYKLEAYADNTLTFCISQPCTMELFSPTGEALDTLSGEAVTDSFTCHAPMDGIYYVALHSAMGIETETSIDYVQGNVKSYAVRYMIDGEIYATDSIFRGEVISVRESPTKEGYTFSGWSEAPEVMPDKDVLIKGSFIANTYEITYMLEGEVYYVDTVACDDVIIVPEVPQREWYVFDGWGDVPATMPAYDLQFAGTYSLVLELGDVNGDGRISVVDISILTNEALGKENAVFIRLAADVNGDGRISVVDVTMTTNKIIAEDE